MSLKYQQDQIKNFFDKILQINTTQDLQTLKQNIPAHLSSLINQDQQVLTIVNEFLDSLTPQPQPLPNKPESFHSINLKAEDSQILFSDTNSNNSSLSDELNVEPPEEESKEKNEPKSNLKTQNITNHTYKLNPNNTQNRKYEKPLLRKQKKFDISPSEINLDNKELVNKQPLNPIQQQQNSNQIKQNIKHYQLTIDSQSFNKENTIQQQNQSIDQLNMNQQNFLFNLLAINLLDRFKPQIIIENKSKTLLDDIFESLQTENTNFKNLDLQKVIRLYNQIYSSYEDKNKIGTLFGHLYYTTQASLEQQNNGKGNSETDQKSIKFRKLFDIKAKKGDKIGFINLRTKLEAYYFLQKHLNYIIKNQYKNYRFLELPYYLVFNIPDASAKKFDISQNKKISIEGYKQEYEAKCIIALNIDKKEYEFYQCDKFKTLKFTFGNGKIMQNDYNSVVIENPQMLFYSNTNLK